jgi:hypothetical protein
MLYSAAGRLRLVLITTTIALLLALYAIYSRPAQIQALYSSRSTTYDILDDIANRTLGVRSPCGPQPFHRD